MSRHDNLEFLSDLIPKTVPFSTIKANAKSSTKKTTSALAANGDGVAAGHAHPQGGEQQSILNGVNGFAVRPGSKSGVDVGELINGTLSAAGGVADDEEDDGPERQLERESKGRRRSIDSVDGTVDEDRMQH